MALEQQHLHIVGIGGTLRSESTSRSALERALQSAASTGATTDLLDLNSYNLPMYVPDKELEEYGPNVQHFIDRVRTADAMIWSTGGYHGTLAGVTKNALDFLEFLAHDERPYLHQRVVGLIATAGGELAAVNAVNAMVHVVHALRGTAAPLFVAIPGSHRVFDEAGNVVEKKWATRLDQLGKLVVEMAVRGQELAIGTTS